MKKMLFYLLIGQLLFGLYSCQKENEINSEFLQSINEITPDVVNKRLAFNNMNNMKGYYQKLSNEISKSDNFDSILFTKEIGYRSLREKVNLATEQILDDNNRQNTEDYVPDEVRQSMLNEYGEINIGNYTYIYQSKNQIYKVPSNEIDVIMAFRNEPKGDDQYIPFEAMSSSTELISNTITMSVDTIGTLMKPSVDTYTLYIYLQHLTILNVECEALQRQFIIHIDEHAHTFDNNTGNLIDVSVYHGYPGTIQLNYGDNSSSFFVNSGDVIHEYPDLGTYTVSSTINYMDRGGFARSYFLNHETITLDIGCTDNTSDISHWVYDVPYDRKMKTKIWFTNDIFGAHAGAYSHAYKISTGNRTQAALYVDITGTFRKSDCSFNVIKSESDQCSDCKKKRAVVSNGFLFTKRSNANGDVFSTHELNDTNGAHIEHEMVLNPCNNI